jgi:hypothetical protein
MNTLAITDGCVNYDDAPLVQLEVAEMTYRLDAGHGSVVAVSRRATGSWDWSFLTEARWDGSRLRSKALDFELSNALGRAIAEVHQREE